jgi:hypothetical protein
MKIIQQDRLDVQVFIKIQLKPKPMSNNIQINPGSFKAVIILAACLLIAFEIFK